MKETPLRIGIIQRVLAGYRIPFFDLLAEQSGAEVSIFAGDARMEEMIDVGNPPAVAARFHAHNVHLFHGKFYCCFQWNILQWLNQWNPDILIVEANMRYLTTPLAVQWMKRRNRPVIGWGLGVGAQTHFIKNRFVQQFDALLTYSQTGAESYQKMGVLPEKIFVAKNAVTPAPKTPIPNRIIDIAKPPVLLFVGRLQPRKRIELLLQACAVLADEFQPVCWIVGDGTIRDDLEAFAAQIYPSARFWGARYGNELDACFCDADLFILPGTGGLALQQAMATGLPVIAAEADGTQADLVTPENGILIRPGDLDDLIDAIRKMLSDREKMKKMGERSYQIVKDEINLEKMAETFLRAIRYVEALSRNVRWS